MTESQNKNFLADFIHIITIGKKSNTYKFALAKSILEFVKNKETLIQEYIKNDENTPIDYSVFAEDFFRYFWRMEKSHIPQNHNNESIPRAVNIVKKVYEKENQPEKYEHVKEDIKEKAVKEIQKTVFGKFQNKTSQVVPRFQNITSGKNVVQKEVFYKNDEKNQRILVYPDAMKFFIENQVLLEKLVVLEWAKFLDKIRPAPGIISKIENPDYDRKSLKPMEKILKPIMKNCFYCDRPLDKLTIHVDHFIPHSYIAENELWNLVLSCSKCNLNKRDSLAVDFTEKLIQTNNKNRKIIKPLENSIKKLEYVGTWEQEMRTIYSNCLRYGFTEITTDAVLEREK